MNHISGINDSHSRYKMDNFPEGIIKSIFPEGQTIFPLEEKHFSGVNANHFPV